MKLTISAFRDITAFILQGSGEAHFPDLEIRYVPNAEVAHLDLKNGEADLVFMSYDDTLSMYFEEDYTDIIAVMPVHGGILNLTGEMTPTTGKNRVGIDTDSGYARALRLYLEKSLPADQYNKLSFIKAGATNIRYDELIQGNIDATLLNPPFSYLPGAPSITRMYDAIGPYQGVIVNVTRRWLTIPANQQTIKQFAQEYYARVSSMRLQPEKTIEELRAFYDQLTQSEAEAIYQRLWSEDGLAQDSTFDPARLAGTEKIYTHDTGVSIKSPRSWVCGVL
tara:strand:- start:367 stop:1206 length:840 start_codon:yes stop_codon:yes gene_type:complete